MADPATTLAPQPKGATGVLVLADGSVAWGKGFGATGAAVGEVCFNTAITGYQEVMTDPSYAGQIVTFTFPHIGNVGTNAEDMESHDVPGAVGCIIREDVTAPSNFRSEATFGDWLEKHGKIGLAGLDTRALTRQIRMTGAPNAVIAHDPAGQFDIPALIARAQGWPGLEGMDLAKLVTRAENHNWQGSVWHLGKGYAASPLPPAGGAGGGQPDNTALDQPTPNPSRERAGDRPHVVAIDYGAKDNIFRNLVKAGAQGYKPISILPSTEVKNAAVTSYEWDIAKSAVTGKAVHERADRYYINLGNGQMAILTGSSPASRFDREQVRDIALTVQVAK